MTHVLDRPMWSALTTRQAHLAVGDPATAVKFDPAIGLFAGAADDSPASQRALADLIPPGAMLGLVEPGVVAPPPGARVVSAAACVQMTMRRLAPAPAPAFQIVPLGDEDAGAMLALATLTQPGPFFARTHELGGFVGVKVDGVLVAMAGRRMRPAGHTEVSAVCTHPDHRGRGYAAGLLRRVAEGVLDDGETPYLHAYAHHSPTVALYQGHGFSVRRTVIYTLLAHA